jgi:succinoglycan biosynthesis protein ExoA
LTDEQSHDGPGEPVWNASTPLVSVLVPIFNEAAVIRDTLPPILSQDVAEKLEILLIDGGSADGTREILVELTDGDDRVRLLDNPGRRQASGLNIGLAAARGRYTCRMDAHCHYGTNYVRAGLERLRRGGASWVAGPAVPIGFDPWSERIATALRSPLGIGGAGFRRENGEEVEVETDTGFGGLIRTATLRALGGWDEDWLVNEDGELAARAIAAGGRIICIPQMRAQFIPRNSLAKLARQYWRYGRGRAKTWRRHPASLRRSHLLPPALVLTALCAILPFRFTRRVCHCALGAYLTVLLAESLRRDPRHAPWLPLVFATMHLSWGAGFLAAALGEATSRPAQAQQVPSKAHGSTTFR